MTVNLILGAAEFGGDFDEAFADITTLFEMPTIFEIGPLAFNRTALIALLMTLACFLLFFTAFRDAKVVPGRLQAFGEMAVDFVRQIALEIIGPKGLKFVPLLFTMFVFIFFMNIAKITPIFMLPPTSRMAFAGMLALAAWLVYVGVGVKEQGLGYFKELAFPPGVPWPLYIILTPIELVSNLILRPFTLAVRLFANMVAGHILVVITLVTVHVFLPSPSGWPVGILGLILAPGVFAFELVIIGLQAYIFTMLTAVYISSSVEPAH
jgi:F-type H+-transporting ATPase subunit a